MLAKPHPNEVTIRSEVFMSVVSVVSLPGRNLRDTR